MATVRLDQKQRALIRAIPDSYHSALANFFGSGPKDIELARRQHDDYKTTLENAGINVVMLDADENLDSPRGHTGLLGHSGNSAGEVCYDEGI